MAASGVRSVASAFGPKCPVPEGGVFLIPALRSRSYFAGMKSIVHVAEVMAENGREGRVFTPGGALELAFSSGGRDEPLTPEHLFAGAYAACFLGALKNAAVRSHLTLVGVTVQAQVSLLENEHDAYSLRVRMRAAVPGLDRHRAEHLMHLAHQSSPYSRAIRGNVEVELATD